MAWLHRHSMSGLNLFLFLLPFRVQTFPRLQSCMSVWTSMSMYLDAHSLSFMHISCDLCLFQWLCSGIITRVLTCYCTIKDSNTGRTLSKDTHNNISYKQQQEQDTAIGISYYQIIRISALIWASESTDLDLGSRTASQQNSFYLGHRFYIKLRSPHVWTRRRWGSCVSVIIASCARSISQIFGRTYCLNCHVNAVIQ